MYRNTYVEINLENVKNNVKNIIRNYSDYKNYLCVATLDEAIEIRKKLQEIPILCLGVITNDYIEICKEQNITITIPSLDYIIKLNQQDTEGLKVHLKINTGMNRLGIKQEEELKEVYKIAKSKKINIEGIYTHIYEASNEEKYNNQIHKFEKMIHSIPIEEIKIIHTSASEAMSNYRKPQEVNGCRLGIIMYGFTDKKELNLKSTFALKSQVIQINDLKPGEKVGYNGIYEAKENEKIAVVAIGYADGIIRQNTGRTVFIKGKEYPIVGNVCMDMLFVRIDDNVELYDEVEILKDNEHIEKVAEYLNTIPYEILCSIGKRVPRIYK